MRTKAERIHLTNKKIAKRVKIVKSWDVGTLSFGPADPILMEPHRAHKFNLNCGCKMCHYYKHVGNSKQKFTKKDLIHNDRYASAKEDYFGKTTL